MSLPRAFPDASSIAVRLIGLLPSRPAMGLGPALNLGKVATGWPMNQIALVGAAIALVLAFVFMLFLK